MTIRPRPQVMRLTEAAAERLKALSAASGKEIAGLKAEIQMLRNQLLSLKDKVDVLPPTSSIARLDEDLNVLWEPQDGCLAWTGPELNPRRRPAARCGFSLRAAKPPPTASCGGCAEPRLPADSRKAAPENKKPRPRGVGGDGKGRGFCPKRLHDTDWHRVPSW